jgi:hypothetical protein
MKRIQTYALIAAMASLPVAASAQAVPDKCITRSELSSGIAYVMPMLMNAAKGACEANLPKDSFLMADNNEMMAKYKAYGDANKSAAMALIPKFGGDLKLEGMDAKSSTDMFEIMIPIVIEDSLKKELKPENCTVINDAIAQLAPLPPENFARFVQVIAVAVMEDDAKKPASGLVTEKAISVYMPDKDADKAAKKLQKSQKIQEPESSKPKLTLCQ